MLGFEATRIVITESDVAQFILEVVQIGDNLLLCGGVVMVDVSGPRSLARVTATVGVTASHAALIVPADVLALAVLVPVPLDAVGLARGGADDINFIDEVVGKLHALVPRAQSALVVGYHVFHGACTGSFVGADEVDEFGLGAEVALGRPRRSVDVIGLAPVMVKIEHGHKAHAVRVVDNVPVTGTHPRAVVSGTPCLALGSEHALIGAYRRTALRKPQQVDIGRNIVLLVQQLCPSGDGDIPLVVLAPTGTIHGSHRHAWMSIGRTETVPKEALECHSSIVSGPSLRH